MRPTLRGNRWRARPVAATGLRLLTILLPIAAAFGATAAVRPFLPSPHGWVRDVAWWGILLFVATAVAMAVERLGRRLVPLIMLLKLSMLFPDRAPSRFAVARHAGSVHKLRARLAEIQADPQAATESASAAAILALATALQTHDRKTRGHAERVRVYTDLLAEELDLSRDDRYRLRWAALLHDIGKLTVNARILNKPRKLNEREWDVIQHPAEGARIATPLLEWMGPWANAIEQHHERFGGGGYPAGIEGEEISLAGRIVAVADCYDT
ncbi:MAG TPA: HD domain-containing phosphohydrolase, partial [Actinomycetota bacterium]